MAQALAEEQKVALILSFIDAFCCRDYEERLATRYDVLEHLKSLERQGKGTFPGELVEKAFIHSVRACKDYIQVLKDRSTPKLQITQTLFGLAPTCNVKWCEEVAIEAFESELGLSETVSEAFPHSQTLPSPSNPSEPSYMTRQAYCSAPSLTQICQQDHYDEHQMIPLVSVPPSYSPMTSGNAASSKEYQGLGRPEDYGYAPQYSYQGQERRGQFNLPESKLGSQFSSPRPQLPSASDTNNTDLRPLSLAPRPQHSYHNWNLNGRMSVSSSQCQAPRSSSHPYAHQYQRDSILSYGYLNGQSQGPRQASLAPSWATYPPGFQPSRSPSIPPNHQDASSPSYFHRSASHQTFSATSIPSITEFLLCEIESTPLLPLSSPLVAGMNASASSHRHPPHHSLSSAPLLPPHLLPVTSSNLNHFTPTTSRMATSSFDHMNPTIAPGLGSVGVSGLGISQSLNHSLTLDLPPSSTPSNKSSLGVESETYLSSLQSKIEVQDITSPPATITPCQTLITNFFCFSDCDKHHPEHWIICSEIMKGSNCNSGACKRRHPNLTSWILLSDKVKQSIPNVDFTQDRFMGRVLQVAMHGKGAKCSKGLSCRDQNCLFQHPMCYAYKQEDLFSMTPTMSKDQPMSLVLVTDDPLHKTTIENSIELGKQTLSAITYVTNLTLSKQFKEYQLSQGNNSPNVFVCFVAFDLSQAIDIAEFGFARIPKVLDATYGAGFQLLLRPKISKPGTNIVVVCQIGSHEKWDSSGKKYVVSEDKAILPWYFVVLDN